MLMPFYAEQNLPSLDIFPIDICKLVNIEELNITGHGISQLPDEFGRLTKLKKLYLGGDFFSAGGNSFKKIPNVIFKLNQLEILNLNSNNLRYLSPEINSLQNLKELYLAKNHYLNIKSVCMAFANSQRKISIRAGFIGSGYDQDTDLFIQLPSLSSLPKEIGLITNLISLGLANNDIKILPKEIGNLKNLTYLDLENNQLSSLPAEIENLTNLTYLNLINNQFSEQEKQKIENLFPKCEISW